MYTDIQNVNLLHNCFTPKNAPFFDDRKFASKKLTNTFKIIRYLEYTNNAQQTPKNIIALHIPELFPWRLQNCDNKLNLWQNTVGFVKKSLPKPWKCDKNAACDVHDTYKVQPTNCTFVHNLYEQKKFKHEKIPHTGETKSLGRCK